MLAQPTPPQVDSAVMTEAEDRDPWNNHEDRHPRAQTLMAEERWDRVNELAPFGSDEGALAYNEYRDWRAENPDTNLVECLNWILADGEAAFPDDEFFTLDASIIATVLGQLVGEGRIDHEAKPFARDALSRQMTIAANYGDHADERLHLLQLVADAIEAG